MTVREIIGRFYINTKKEEGFAIQIYEPRVGKRGQKWHSLILTVDQFTYFLNWPDITRQTKKYRAYDNLPADFHVDYKRDKSLELHINLLERKTAVKNKPLVENFGGVEN